MREALEKAGKRVIIIHYADAVKWILRDFFHWDGVKDEHGRHLLQYVGTDVVRASFPNFWTGIVAGLLKSFEPINEFDVAIIPDARFPNEIEVVASMLTDPICVRIIRTNADGSQWLNPALTAEQHNHPSETSLDCYNFDYILHNDQDIEYLNDGAKAILIDLNLLEGETYDK